MITSPKCRLSLALSTALVTGYANGQVLEEVVVTAQKREQSIQDVPISIGVLDQGTLEASGITNVADLAKISPSLRLQQSVSSAGTGMLIRGVGGAAFATGFENSVGTMIDGVVTGPGGGSLADFWDIERIEVLRGPQGTLFGKNTSAGAINVISRNATREFESTVGLRWGETYDEYRADVAVSGPISETLAGRVSAFWYDQQEGVIDNIVRNDTENRRERWGVRLSGLYENGPLTIDANLSYVEQDNVCCSRTFSAVDPASAGSLTNAFVVPFLEQFGIEATEDNRTGISDGPIGETVETLHTVVDASWVLESGITLKSITGYRNWDQNEFNDVDFLPVDIISGRIDGELELFTQEFQLLSPVDQPLQYVLGLYYYDAEISDNTVLDGGTSVVGFFGATNWNNTVDNRNMAVFGQASYDFNERWSTFAGLRILNEEIEAEGRRGPLGGGLPHFAFPGDFAPASADNSDTDWVGTAGVQFRPDSDTMIFASVTRGYKGAAIDTTLGSSFFTGGADAAVLDPEIVLSYELGVKGSALNQRVLFSGTLFHSEFDDFQATAFDGTSFVLRNAGVLQSQGVEIDITAGLWEGGTLNFSGAYVDATFDEYTGAPCTVGQVASGACEANGGVQDLSGEPLNNNAEWQYTVNFRQDTTLGGVGVYFLGEYAWTDDVIFDGDLDPITTQEAFGLANFKVGAVFAAAWDVALFARNAFDEEYSLRTADAPLYTGAYGLYPALDRMVGVEVRGDF